VWEREIMAVAATTEIAAKKGYNRGILFGLKRAWPSFIGYGQGEIEAEEEEGAAIEEEVGTTSAAEREAAGGWDEESITEGRGSILIYLGL
jgi:hypothetical protein